MSRTCDLNVREAGAPLKRRVKHVPIGGVFFGGSCAQFVQTWTGQTFMCSFRLFWWL